MAATTSEILNDVFEQDPSDESKGALKVSN